MLEPLRKIQPEGQAHEVRGPVYKTKTSVEILAKSQVSQTAWKQDMHQWLIEIIPKRQAFQLREIDPLQSLIETISKG